MKQVFINLPVKNLQQSVEFYTALGFSVNHQFSDDSGKCMVWSDHIFVMLLNHEKFSSFTDKAIADIKNKISGLFALSVESVDEMNKIMENVLNTGGIEPTELRDYGFMQQRTIEDFDGHTWEIFYMDMSQIPTE